MAARKQAVSIRMNPGDIRDVKKLADRLQASESDVVRYAVKSTLLRLAPLCEDGFRGRGLVPVLMEASSDLFHHFELDAARLDAIVNGNVKDARERVDRADLQIIAMHVMHRTYSVTMPATAFNPGPKANIAGGPEPRAASPEQVLQRYLYDKYVLRTADAGLSFPDPI
jgi:hypothetical protein